MPKKTASQKRKNPRGRPRLDREDWIDAALRILAAKGVRAITIDALSTELEITRGSFYHHFTDREDLYKSMLQFWLDRWTTAVRDTVDPLHLDGRTSLSVLDKLIRKEKAAHMDAVVRTWAHRDPLPAEYTKKADKIRMDYIRSLFKELGFKGQELEVRSRLFYFYEAFEPMMTIKPKVGTVDELAVLMLKILTDR